MVVLSQMRWIFEKLFEHFIRYITHLKAGGVVVQILAIEYV